MNPFAIDPDKLSEELFEFNKKLALGINTFTELGKVEVGASPKETVYEEGKVILYHYKPAVKRPDPVPVLIVYALVNRPYMMDLQEDRSLIKGLLKQGLDIYLIDWGYPDQTDKYLTLDDYINGYMDSCVDVVRERSGVEKINLFGVCQGGTFSLCYTSLHQDKIRNLITTVTPVDFHTEHDLLSRLVQGLDVDECVDSFGNIPGELLNWTFLMLKPFRLMGQKYIDLVDVLDDPEKVMNFMRMEKWIFDSPDQAGEAYRQFIKHFYQENGLVKGSVRIGGQLVDLERITIPVLNIYARDDHLVPPDSSKALAGCVASEDYTEMEFPGGHIGIYVSARSQHQLPPAIGRWLRERAGQDPHSP